MAKRMVKAGSVRPRAGIIVMALAAVSAFGLMRKRGRKTGLAARLLDGAAMAVAAKEVLVPAFARTRSRFTWMAR